MNDFGKWADAQSGKIDEINELLNEIIDAHNKMQSILSEAIIKCRSERGVRAIERFLEDKQEI